MSTRTISFLLLSVLAFQRLASAQLPPFPALPVASTNAPAGESVTLTWTASPDGDVSGYRIYYFKPGGPTNSLGVGNILTARITGLTFPTSFYATAVDVDGLESVPSNLIKDLHWETDVTVKGQTASSPVGPFAGTFTVTTATNVPAVGFYRLLIESNRRLATTP